MVIEGGRLANDHRTAFASGADPLLMQEQPSDRAAKHDERFLHLEAPQQPKAHQRDQGVGRSVTAWRVSTTVAPAIAPGGMT